MSIRTKADLNRLFALDLTGEVSNADIRDLIQSMAVYGGAFSMNDNATATTFTGTDVFTKVLGESTAGRLDGFAHADNRLTSTISVNRLVDIACSASMFAALANQDILVTIAINGVPQPHTDRRVAAGLDHGNIGCNARVAMGLNDYAELWIANETTTSAVTVDHVNFKLNSFMI